MWFGLSISDRSFWQKVAHFARQEVLPRVVAWDDQGSFPRSLWEKLGAKGLLGLCYPRALGGSGHGPKRLAIALDAFAYGSKDLGIVNSWGIHSAMVGLAIVNAGTDAQQRRYLPAMAAGRIVGAFALTEPEAGSHVVALQTTARREGNTFVIRGHKSFVTNGPQADLFLVIAKTGASGTEEMAAFLLERGTPGLVVGPAELKSCVRTSPCCDIELRDCRLPAKQRLGYKDTALKDVVFPALDRDRCVVWAGRLGRLRAILEDSTAYAKRRRQFGKPLCQHQAILFKLADMKVNLDAAEALLSRALMRLERNESVRLEAAVARLFLGKATTRSADEAVQIFGGRGFYPKNHVERYSRDARLDGIGGGTFEIQRMIIGRKVVESIVDTEAPWLSEAILPEQQTGLSNESR
jgi:alkylation response protein AidB-like acyl-CoA dehydrogenase